MCVEKKILFFLSVLVYIARLEAVLTRNDELFLGFEADRYDWSNHPCKRECKDGEKPKECYYAFVVEIYTTMSKACYNCPQNITDCYRPHCVAANGVKKAIYVANRQLPGPTIEVCKNDLVVVSVKNAMLAESTTIHWHGIRQRNTPYMDGVPFVTQCPILPGGTFLYTYNVTESGTYMWHSHIGSQRDDGLFGAIVVHAPPKDNTHKNLYDFDNQVMVINDWTNDEGAPDFVIEYQAAGATLANTILINGLARYKINDSRIDHVPSTVFNVKKGSKYRFRLIFPGATDCPIEVSIDNHPMLIISMDGNDVQPVEVDSLFIYNGERIDFVVNANQEIDNYWIRYRGFSLCQMTPTSGIYEAAVLRYEGAEFTYPKSEIGYTITSLPNPRVFNPLHDKKEYSKIVHITSLNSIAENDECITRQPDQQLFISYDFYEVDNYDFQRKNLYGLNDVPDDFKRMTLQLNHISLKLQPFPLLSQREMIKDDTFCNSTSMSDKSCDTEFCACTHVLQVKLNSVVELVIIDEGATFNDSIDFLHPLHLHGTFFRVVAMGNLTADDKISADRLRQLDQEGKIERKLDHAPIKDTIKIPSNGYAILRFQAINPGYWLYHCHIDQHANLGMALVFKVGEHKDFPPKPPNFPTCGTYNENDNLLRAKI